MSFGCSGHPEEWLVIQLASLALACPGLWKRKGEDSRPALPRARIVLESVPPQLPFFLPHPVPHLATAILPSPFCILLPALLHSHNP